LWITRERCWEIVIHSAPATLECPPRGGDGPSDAGYDRPVRGRPPTAGEGSPACPFVAFAEEPDSRAGVPDHRHRCFAQEPPEPRARAHQERFCLTSAFAGCAYFQDWAVRQAAERVPEPVPVAARVTTRTARPDRASRAGAGPGQLAFDAVDPAFERADRGERYDRDDRYDRDRDRNQRRPARAEPERPYARTDAQDRRYVRVGPDDRGYDGIDGDDRRYDRVAADDRRYDRVDADDRSYRRRDPGDAEFERVERTRGRNGADAADDADDAAGWESAAWEPSEERDRPREPRRERSRAATRSGNGGPTNADERYTGYPTAARLLGIGSSPAYLPGGDELAEPGKWQRSERLQSWLEDAEQSARTARVETVERDEWSDSFAAVDPDLDADALDVARPGELQAGVLPHRASQARRTPMPQPQRIGRQAARRGMPWERRATPETFPLLRPQQEPRSRRISPVLLAVLALLLAAGVVFAVPTLFAGRPRQAATAPTPTATATVAPSEAPPSFAVPTPRVYTVAKGDTIRGIASQFKLTMDELLGANPAITNPSRIRIGQKIVIPSPGAAATSAAP
jgi:LysM domain-containing protein